MSAEVAVQFVGKKVSRVCWRREVGRNPEIFAIGSYDEAERNSVDIYQRNELGTNSIRLCSYPIGHDVTDLKFVNAKTLLVASANGSVSLLQFDEISRSLKLISCWNELHSFDSNSIASCTSLSLDGNNFVSGGEDGRVNFMRIDRGTPVKTVGSPTDFCAINSLEWISTNEVVMANSAGQLLIIDGRLDDKSPVTAAFRLPNRSMGAFVSLAADPSQKHTVVVGTQTGGLAFWDLRQTKSPASVVSAHKGPVWSIKFHPSYTENLFSCSNDGSLLHWDSSQLKSSFSMTQGSLSVSNPWLMGEAAQSKIRVQSILDSEFNFLPLNSVDIQADSLLCGGSNASLFTVTNMSFK